MRLVTFVAVSVGFAVTGCASSRKAETPDASGAPVLAPAPPPAASAPSAGAPAGQTVDDQAGRARFRVLEAQREKQSALAEQSAANAEQARAAADLVSAKQSTDSVAQARATELARAAESRRRLADAHLAYAEKLVAAREAEVRAASAHAQVLELGRTASPTPGAPTDPQLAAAQTAEQTARADASRLGEEALAAQRSWQELNREAQARTTAPAPGTSASGTAPSAAGATAPSSMPGNVPAESGTAPATAPATGR